MTLDRRSDLIIGAAAVVVGSAIGGTLALRSEPTKAAPAPVSSPAHTSASPRLPSPAGAPPPSSPSPASGAAAVAPSAPTGSPPARLASLPDPRGAAVAQIKGAVLRFVVWSHDHAGARCPDAAALGVAAVDPWGRSLRILCADQPDDQLAGVLSLGLDGLPGTPDDVASWALGPDVTDLVRGTPWGSGRSASASAGSKRLPVPAPHGAATSRTRPSARSGAGRSDTDGDGIPDRR